MQPQMSTVDHESRHNTVAEDEGTSTERTPLLHRFPESERDAPSPVSTAVITLLLIILISGVIIGIYLLIVQSNSENVLPPVETPLRLVSESQWNSGKRAVVSSTRLRTQYVVVVQTDTPTCHSKLSCSDLLLHMKENVTEQSLPYNFLVSSDGETFEALGWHQASRMFPGYPSALVLAFIGNFTTMSPTATQLQEAKLFFAESVSLQHLDPSYSIVGKTTKYTPKYLFQSLSTLRQWDSKLSDIY